MIWLCVGVPWRFKAVLPDFIKALHDRYGIDGEVAFALNIPHDACIHDLDHNFLRDDIPGNVIEAIENGQVYLGQQLIAALPFSNPAGGKDHAEYRLLVSPGGGEVNTPMHHLLNRRRAQDDCLVFFSTYTPCVSMCTNAFHYKHILNHLQIFHNWDREFKAFVFYDIYDTDKDTTKETVLNSLRAIHNNGDILVFRCNSYDRQNHCFNCMDQPDVEKNDCFYGWDKRKG